MSLRVRRPAALPSVLSFLALLAGAPLAAQTPPIKYVAFGDSITAGVGDDAVRPTPGYPPRLQTLLTTAGVTATVENDGLGGEKTPEGLTRIDQYLNAAKSGDVLLLMEGTNDISRSLSVESTLLNLDEMARKAEVRGLTAVHVTVIPRRPDARFDPLNLATDQMNGLIRNLAGVRERRLVDPYQIFGVLPDYYQTYYSHATDDPVGHPNGVGYDLLARVFSERLRNLDTVPPVPGVVTPASGSTTATMDTAINVDVWDFGAGIDLANTFLLVNGAVVTATPTGTTQRAHLHYQPPAGLSGSVSVGLRARDLATPANSTDKTIARFSIAVAPLPGDVNGDSRVDGTDLVLFALGFGALRGGSTYTEAADLNHDGRIDGQDLAVLASNFGRANVV